MKVVVDTNIIFSALLKTNKIRNTLLESKNVSFYSCNFIFVELFKHKEKLLKLAHNKEEEILTSLEVILKRITLINEETISFLSRKRAYEFVKDIDLKDLPFVALALELDAFLWTGDKKLQDGLKSKGFNKFFLLKKVLR